MGSLEVIIQKNDFPDNAKPISKDGKFIRIEEMSVDIHLLCVRRRGGRRRHKAVSHFVGIHFGVMFIKGLESFNEGIKGFGGVFSNKEFNTGGIKSEELGK